MKIFEPFKIGNLEIKNRIVMAPMTVDYAKLRVAFGRKKEGVDFKAIDEKPVHFFFLIVAPPLEVSNQYLPVLGKIAQFSKESDVPGRLLEITEPKQFLALLEEKGV